MPKVIDHQQRRAEVVAVAARIVVTEGRAALTVRHVAREAGYSSTVVSHYFEDVTDLLHQTYSFAADRTTARVERVLARDPADLVGVVEAVLPLDRERTDDWRIWFAFWSDALASPRFSGEQRRRARNHVRRLRACLDLLQEQERLRPGVDIDDAAHRLAALVPGIAAEAIFDPRAWNAARQRRVLDSELGLIGLTRPPRTARTRRGDGATGDVAGPATR